MRIKILIKGLALCYADQDYWNVFFVCDEVHPLNFKHFDAGDPPIPKTLHKAGMNRNIIFNIGNSCILPPEKGRAYGSIFNLAADYAHGAEKLGGKRSGKTDVVSMKIPSATLDADTLTEKRYFVQEAKLGYPVQIIDRIASCIKAEFDVTDTNGFTMSIRDDEENLETRFSNNGETLTLEFNNDCGANCKEENDFILFYDWLESKDGKKYVAGQIKNSELIVFSDPQKIENFLENPALWSIEHGNCDPATIDPPPNPPIEP